MAVNYYVSPVGNDANSGLSAADPWQTIAKVNTSALAPGDQVLFEGGATFSSATGLYFTTGRCGSAANPIIISSYGTGRATLNITNDHGFRAFECAGFEITDLNFVGAGRLVNSFTGINFYSENPVLPLASRYSYIRVARVEVSGFNLGGVVVESKNLFYDSGGTDSPHGYEDIQISYVVAHDNGHVGIEVAGDWFVAPGVTSNLYPIKDVVIQHCTAYNNPGQNGLITAHTGSGILIGNAENALIEHCLAYNNGADNVTNTGGPVGIWFWDSKDGIIQNCESYENKTSSIKDGGGFDLDGGCVNCTIQYCYSHDNHGAGFLLAEFAGARDMLNNTIRYNISENDGRNNDYAGIQFWREGSNPTTGALDQTYVYNNVIFTSAAPGADPAAFRSISGTINGARIANNVFISADGLRLVDKQFNADITFAGNAYFSQNGVYEYNEAGVLYNSLASWRASGQETLAGAPIGIEQDPMLVDAGNGGIVGNTVNLPGLNAYQTQAGSPLEDAGLDLNAVLGLNMGSVDFYGTTIPSNVDYDIGAYEAPGAVLSADDSKFWGERIRDGQVFLQFDLGLGEAPKSVELERSLNGQEFEFVLFPPKNRRVGYVYDHKAPSKKLFYRLKFTEADGQVAYSRVLEILPFDGEDQMFIYPNPISDKISIQLMTRNSYKEVVVELISLTGETVFSIKGVVEEDNLDIQLSQDLADGLYILTLLGPETILRRQVLLKR